jgi:hypothetical protein
MKSIITVLRTFVLVQPMCTCLSRYPPGGLIAIRAGIRSQLSMIQCGTASGSPIAKSPPECSIFLWTLSRNWQADSLRLLHFLPVARAATLAKNNFKCTREDFILALRGMAITYGACYGRWYQSAFQEMHSIAVNEQTGHSFSFEYLESLLNDMFYRFATAARAPRIPVLLPGGACEVTPIDLSPRRWAAAFLAGFTSLSILLQNSLPYQTYNLRRHGQPQHPHPVFRPVRASEPREKPDREPQQRGTATQPTPRGAAREQKLCFMSFMRVYKINLRTTNEPPKACEKTCTRLHHNALPKGFSRTTALNIARITNLVTQENRAGLITAINADPKLK